MFVDKAWSNLMQEHGEVFARAFRLRLATQKLLEKWNKGPGVPNIIVADRILREFLQDIPELVPGDAEVLAGLAARGSFVGEEGSETGIVTDSGFQ